MLVTDFEISHYRWCADSARHLANVSMTLPDRIVTMYCQIDDARNVPERHRTRAFLREATRQLQRMPEFRSGRTTLEFADYLPHMA